MANLNNKKEIQVILKSFPITDAHCHPFNPSNEGSDDFRLDFNLYHEGTTVEMVKDTILSHKMLSELAKTLGLDEKTSAEKIIVKRNLEYKKNPGEYINMLFSSVNLDTLIVDTGYPDIEFGVESVDLGDFRKLVPSKVFKVFRIEPGIFKIFNNLPDDFFEAENIIESEMEKALKVEKVVGFKSIIAYETGLDIKIESKNEVIKAYNSFKKYKNYEDEKVLRDYFVILALKKCRENDIPMQFHTGMGSIPILDLRKANPIVMQDFLGKDEIKNTKIVLTHAGHPYEQETGMLVSSFPNLYCDISAISSYFGVSSLKNALLKLLEMAPLSKIMFGTDGGIIPETYWFGALQGLEDIGIALDEMVKYGWISAGKAEDFAFMLLNKNAEKLYKL